VGEGGGRRTRTTATTKTLVEMFDKWNIKKYKKEENKVKETRDGKT
jgi:hypothetical protein